MESADLKVCGNEEWRGSGAGIKSVKDLIYWPGVFLQKC